MIRHWKGESDLDRSIRLRTKQTPSPIKEELGGGIYWKCSECETTIHRGFQGYDEDLTSVQVGICACRDVLWIFKITDWTKAAAAVPVAKIPF